MTEGTQGFDGGGSSGGSSTSTDKSGKADGKGKKGKERSFWKELPILILIALVLALVIKSFFVQAFSIPSQSMQNTLQVGDRVLVDKLTPWFGAKPERGDVIVFHDPGHWLGEQPPSTQNSVGKGIQTALSWIGLMPSANEQDLIKRVVAVGGDTVQCSGTGTVSVNGKALDERSYIYEPGYSCSDKPIHGGKPYTVPKGYVWVMGDHRQDSLDSRYHETEKGGGAVPLKDVVGRAFAVAWPINRWDLLQVPHTFASVPNPSSAASAPMSGGSGSSALNPVSAPLPGAVLAAGLLPLAWRRRRSGTVLRHDSNGDGRRDDGRD
ncbi:signal peptidase I [Mangrovactinospora gilvigrisea]|uniref:Signal peptidase I n=1 Tax=Mangrovactinospora gilvigrisea TaxID=1428644 RepID=A0A1J7BDT4_9ACTN|nr:signal peptidase I [Mangrovactinospora gilvigrisea]OIV36741.1 signal peptidase I [Mangrovactinospora gilvigrisea]